MTDSERREKARLSMERYRRSIGVLPRSLRFPEMSGEERRRKQYEAGARWRRKMGKPPRIRPLLDRLLEKRKITDSGCWEWMGTITKNGYGTTTQGARSTKEYTHRISYRLFIREIPDGLELDHLCHHRCCFNPEHLEPVTRAENIRRGDLPDILSATSKARWDAKSEAEKQTQVRRASRARWNKEET